jgi:anti-sigma factor RsiW
MKVGVHCGQAETLAGAIALGEASEAERREYRAHVAGCPKCLAANGGEREIERVMAVALQARDDESWEPALRPAGARRSQPLRVLRWGAVAATAALFAFTVLNTQPRPAALHRAAHASEAIAALNTQSAPHREQQAESLTFATAPARREQALFALSVDRNGRPTSCRIVRTSGFRSLDDAVCRAAMQTRTNR